MRGSLIYSVLPPEPIARKESRTYHGPKPAGAGPRGGLSDAQFLHIRALHEIERLPYSALAERLRMPRWLVAQVCEYRTRLHLEPTKADLTPPATEPAAGG